MTCSHYCGENGRPQPLPNAVGDDHYCPFQINGIGGEKAKYAAGMDAFQSIELAFRIIGAELDLLNREHGGQLRWEGDEHGNLGFPYSVRRDDFQGDHETRVVDPGWDYRELLRMLSEAIARGCVEQVPVMKPPPYAPRRTWYQEKETGVIYSLDPPGERPGWWTEVDPKDFIAPGEKIQ
jgi:hypothetical protein